MTQSLSLPILPPDWDDYELIDSGDSRKLERFGKFVIVRHEPKAWWRPALPEAKWAEAHAAQDEEGRLSVRRGLPKAWPLRLPLAPGLAITLEARMSETSRHIGVFPEQAPNWRLMARLGLEMSAAAKARGAERPRLLNLFGYTGAATLAAQAAGFAATHVDASRPAIAWAKRNQELSDLDADPARILLDDAAKFVAREKRRGSRYQAILLDPPSFGRGPNREVWKVEGMIRGLLSDCADLLADDARLLLLTMYNIEASALMLANLMDDVLPAKNRAGAVASISAGELAVPHTAKGAQARWLPRSIFARWQA